MLSIHVVLLVSRQEVVAAKTLDIEVTNTQQQQQKVLSNFIILNDVYKRAMSLIQ